MLERKAIIMMEDNIVTGNNLSKFPIPNCSSLSEAYTPTLAIFHFLNKKLYPKQRSSSSSSSPPPPPVLDPIDMAESDNTVKNNKNGITSLVEKEHMFDKVVTPSDVGKLNRLVIPKQHAEKFFPLDSGGDKALLLNFEDRNGKSWRFRYSYWTSSQSYVMTKGWSRFVKDKKLDAGDIVSFERGIGDLGRGRLFIDSRRRPDPTLIPARNFPYFVPVPGWGTTTGLYGSSVQLPETMSFLRPLQSHDPLINFGANHGAPPPSPNFPAAAAATKTLRLFGVNMMEADSNSSSSSTNYNFDDRRPEITSSNICRGKSSLDLDL